MTPGAASSPTDLLSWLETLAPEARDGAIDDLLGIAPVATRSAPPGEHLVGYHASGVSAIVRTLAAVPVMADDVFVDLGAGLGKVVLLAALLTGAKARGIELQQDLVTHARRSAERLAVDATFIAGDVREVDQAALEDGTVFYLYAPFVGPALASALARVESVASRHAVVVCALGIELTREHWLARRDGVEDFWLSIYDSRIDGVAPRPTARISPLPAAADAIGREVRLEGPLPAMSGLPPRR